MTEPGATRDIVVEGLLPHGPEAVWKALTTAELIGRWLMPNDFEPVVGRRFTFRTRPMGEWDGVVHCEVLEVEPLRRLSYSWKGGAESNDGYGSRLDSVVTWVLTPTDAGTHVKMTHSGFRSPDNDFAYDMMSPGWGRVLEGLGRAAAEAG